ncbi:MAG: hypothetical protein CSA36_08760 [Draconibacterium sp.]|nr:MAG: hypothetical protein CSA36_08760 [Draconibacterium sp.]
MWLKLAKIVGMLLLIVFMIATLAFTSFEKKEAKCTSIEISYKADDAIHISEDKLLRMVSKADRKVLSKPLNGINSEIIEQSVEKLAAIKDAQVYKIIKNDTGTYNGILVIKVKHRKPVLRVISDSGSYYIDKEGFRVPVSTAYTTNVLVANGALSEKFAREKILPFVLYIEKDDFWNAQIEQIYVESDGNVKLVPLVGDHLIEMGTLDNFERKLKRVKAFYEQVMSKNNWNKYRQISVKYNNQVIAKKN